VHYVGDAVVTNENGTLVLDVDDAMAVLPLRCR
jgi:hypothetical protein